MACSLASVTFESYEEPISYSSSSAIDRSHALRHRRRHSSYHTRPWTSDQDNIPLLMDNFLTELDRRLDFLDTYGHLSLDSGIVSAWTTLHYVRNSCSAVSDEVIGAGRRRAKIFVETLEERYNDALSCKDTMEQKVQEGVKMMEEFLADIEARAYAMRDANLAVANDFIEQGLKRVDSGLEQAHGVLYRGRQRIDSGLEHAHGAFNRGLQRMDSGLEGARRVVAQHRQRVNSGLEQAREIVDDGLLRARAAHVALKLKIDRAVLSAKKHGLIRYEDLPDPWRGNPHILRGYRFCETRVECVRSIVGVSNELVNIWSHLLGFVLVLAVALYLYPSSANFRESTYADILIASVFFIAACKCLACSTIWHTMNSISSQTQLEQFACVDYTGISLLIATSVMTSEYTAFYCDPLSRWFHMTLTAILGVTGTIATWHPTFNRHDKSWLRVGLFVALGATGFVPVFQLACTRGPAWAYYFYKPIVKSLVVYLVGAAMYASKVPERWRPGFFDYFGGSHNIWHFAVLFGILFHYVAMQEFFNKAFEMARAGCSVY